MTGGTYYLETFGCQMNVLDSQLVDGQMRQRGLRAVDSFGDADIILFNTCSVRQHAEDKVLSRLGQLQSLKRRRPEAIIGVIGCMAEREKEGLFVKAPHVDLLCGPGELNRLPALIDEVQERHERVTGLAGSLSRRTEVLARALEYDSLEALDMSRTPGPDESTLQSYIRVQRGCDKFCTYCVVPFTRGAERSRPASHIVAEAKMLADRGCREITLLGQTVNSYVHQDDGRAVRFANLLEKVHEVEGIDRIRFVTSFPADWDEDIFRVMRDYPRIMPYLHIPAQSGSDRILKAMRRTYTAATYLKLMDTARKYVPDISLAGDFIVGFCGETDDDFAASIDLVRRVEYKSLFVFKYSPRPGTAADRNLTDDIPMDIKIRRNNELLAVQSEFSHKHKQKLIGQTVEVLVEGFSKLGRRALHESHEATKPRSHEGGTTTDAVALIEAAAIQESEQDRGSEVLRNGAGVLAGNRFAQLVGRTPGDMIAVFHGRESLIGSIVSILVDRASPLTLFGNVESVVSPARPKAEPPTNRGLPILVIAH